MLAYDNSAPAGRLCFILLLILTLAGCHGGGGSPAPTPAAVVTISDLTSFLVQARCPDGSPPTNCASPVPQRVSDVMYWRKHDYGIPAAGYQIEDAVLSTDGTYVINDWAFAGAAFTPALGDGGEVYIVENGNVRIPATEDGGTLPVPPAAYAMQYFVGQKCGGTGWLAFDDKAPTGSWRDVVAELNIALDPNACPLPRNPSYTRWRLETLSVPFTILGVRQTLSLPCLIYEHWNGASITEAKDVEQAIWAAGWGRIWWASYAPGPAVELGYRLPAIPWPAPPERTDFHLRDARLSTNVIATAGSGMFPQSGFGWPPAGFVP